MSILAIAYQRYQLVLNEERVVPHKWDTGGVV